MFRCLVRERLTTVSQQNHTVHWIFPNIAIIHSKINHIKALIMLFKSGCLYQNNSSFNHCIPVNVSTCKAWKALVKKLLDCLTAQTRKSALFFHTTQNWNFEEMEEHEKCDVLDMGAWFWSILMSLEITSLWNWTTAFHIMFLSFSVSHTELNDPPTMLS